MARNRSVGTNPRTAPPPTPRYEPKSPRRIEPRPTPPPDAAAPEPLPPPRPGRFAAAVVRALSSAQAGPIALTLAAAVRAAHLVWFTRSPLSSHLLLDHAVYDTWAQRIAAGDWIGTGVFWVDPLYAYVLAVIYKAFGHSLLAVRALQCVFGVFTVALTGVIARRVDGRAAVGNAAMFVAALYVPLIHNEVQIEKAALTTFLATAALAAFLRGTARSLLSAGLLTGLAVLGRGNLLLAVPAGALALLLERRADDPDVPPFALGPLTVGRAAAGRAARFTAGAALVVGLLTARNVLVAHELLLTTSIGGPSLYAAQVRGNVGGVYSAPSFVRPMSEFEHDDFHAEAVRRNAREMTDTEVNAYWAREAVGEMFAAPGETLERSFVKLRLAFHQFEVADNDDVYLSAQFSRALRLPFFWMGQVIPFALLGAIVLWRRSRAARLTAGAAAVYLSTLVLFYVMGRLRLPMTPALIALATAGAAWLLERVSARDTRRALAGAAVVALVAIPCLTWSPWIEDARTSGVAVASNNFAAQLFATGRNAEGIAMYERAIATRPSSVVGAMRTLGDTYLRMQRYADAERVMRLVLVYKPESPLGRAALVRLYEAMARDPSTGGTNAVRRRLAAAYQSVGRNAEADRVTAGGEPSETPPPSTAPGAAPAVPATPPATADEVAAAGAIPTFDSATRTAITDALGAAPRGSPVWITATTYDARAIARADELALLFRRAGWEVRGVQRTTVRVRPGVFVFAADDVAPPYVATVQQALTAARLAPVVSSGYRAYLADMVRDNPAFQGFPMAAEQTWVLVIGRVE